MIGAIIGDVVGSRFEFRNRLSKDFQFLHPDCEFTDDTVMTCAVAQALLDSREDWSDLSEKTIAAMQRIGRRYPGCGYGARFIHWMFSDDPKPYNSCGNGSAMRVSPVGFVANDVEEEEIRDAMWEYYDLSTTVDMYRTAWTGHGREICQVSLPQALVCFLEGNDYEDVIRNCVSIGGDSDTIAAIAGGIAEAYYGVPQEFQEKLLGYLPMDLREIVEAFRARFMSE